MITPRQKKESEQVYKVNAEVMPLVSMSEYTNDISSRGTIITPMHQDHEAN